VHPMGKWETGDSEKRGDGKFKEPGASKGRGGKGKKRGRGQKKRGESLGGILQPQKQQHEECC